MGQNIIHYVEDLWQPTVDYINHCRLCHHHVLHNVYHLGTQYVSGFVSAHDVADGYPGSITCPIDLVQCGKCELVQTRYTVPPERLYRGDYWYRSGVTSTMRSALETVLHRSRWFLEDTKSPQVIIDIGSNDGTLLKLARSLYSTAHLVGVEPSPTFDVPEVTSLYDTHVPHLWSYSAYHTAIKRVLSSNDKAHLITALGMLYDLSDPLSFMRDVAEALHSDGVFITQLMCLAGMVRTMDLGNLAHEHVEFYTLENLRNLFEKVGLEIIYIEKNTVNVESYLIVAKHQNTKLKTAVGQYTEHKFKEEHLHIINEYDKKWSSLPLMVSSFNTALRNITSIYTFIREETALKKKVYLYGASTKGNVILQCMQDMYPRPLNNFIQGAAERSPSKYGLYTVGTGIKIMPEEEVRHSKPDYMIVMPHTFMNEFIDRERSWLERGGSFIVPVSGTKVYHVGATNKIAQVKITP